MPGSPLLTRRGFLQAAGATALTTALYPTDTAFAASPKQTLTVGTRVLEVLGKPATVFGITNAQGRAGLTLDQADGFNVSLVNTTSDETVIHWHGLTPPFAMDGNMLSQPLVPAGGSFDYNFLLQHSGTNWLHSHHGLQEASLMAAPLIIRNADDKAADRQEVVMILHDFSFTPPEEILAKLTGGDATHIGSGMAAMGNMEGMDHSKMQMGSMGGMMPMDLNDITFDAFLANDRDLNDPDVVQVDAGGQVRLRIINAASSTNFWIDLGQVVGTLTAVDGMPVRPVRGSRFEIAMAQRLDIDVTAPRDAPLPVMAQREGDRARTGIILAANSVEIAKLDGMADQDAPPVLTTLERRLSASAGLPVRSTDRQIDIDLTGDMMAYSWGMNGKSYADREPLMVARGERVEITFRNSTMMSHPMHLHGHHFQVVGLGQARLHGAMRDTVLVPAMDSVTVAFDANNPGEWPLHCHNLYHMASGMMTTLKYA